MWETSLALVRLYDAVLSLCDAVQGRFHREVIAGGVQKCTSPRWGIKYFFTEWPESVRSGMIQGYLSGRLDGMPSRMNEDGTLKIWGSDDFEAVDHPRMYRDEDGEWMIHVPALPEGVDETLVDAFVSELDLAIRRFYPEVFEEGGE